MGVKLTKAELVYTAYLRGLNLPKLKEEMEWVFSRQQYKQSKREEESNRVKLVFVIREINNRRTVSFETKEMKKEDVDA